MRSAEAKELKEPVIIGVAGGTGSGKTTVSKSILDRVGSEQIAYLQHDHYYKDWSRLPRHERTKVNFDHPDSLDNELLAQHLRALKEGQVIEMPRYDFTTHTRISETVRVDPRKVILVEGILILAVEALRDLMDIKVFVDTDADIRLIRRIERDMTERGRSVESVIRQYTDTVRPMHLQFVEPSKRYADIIIPEGGFNVTAIDMIVAKVKAMIGTDLSPG